MGTNTLTFAPVIAATYKEAKLRQILQLANSLDHAGLTLSKSKVSQIIYWQNTEKLQNRCF